jgi:hypothetical protein
VGPIRVLCQRIPARHSEETEIRGPYKVTVRKMGRILGMPRKHIKDYR